MAMVSILMPAYNGEKYIGKAIESVINQTYPDWELIIIDDCSTDSTKDICDKYSVIDKRIKVFESSQNQGISKSKNAALDKAEGKYIAFCDDDDYMDENTIAYNVRMAEEYDFQVVRWSYKTLKVDENEVLYKTIECKCDAGLYLNRQDIFDNYRNVHKMLSCDWTGLYRRDLLNSHNIRFNENFFYGGEDTLFNVDVLEYAENMGMNEKFYYDWYLRKKHSTTAKRNINFCISMTEVAKREKELINNNCLDKDSLWQDYGEFYHNLILNYAKSLLPQDKVYVDEIIRTL